MKVETAAQIIPRCFVRLGPGGRRGLACSQFFAVDIRRLEPSAPGGNPSTLTNELFFSHAKHTAAL